MHSGHEIATNGQWTGDMAPEHNVGLEINPDADDHGYRGESDGFKVLMVVMEEEGSCKQVWLSGFSTTVDVDQRVAGSENFAPPYMIGSMISLVSN
jgi:hypothetical protein